MHRLLTQEIILEHMAHLQFSYLKRPMYTYVHKIISEMAYFPTYFFVDFV